MLLYQQPDFRIERNIAVHVLQHPDKVNQKAPGKHKHHQKMLIPTFALRLRAIG
jgi:hypothetical protein